MDMCYKIYDKSLTYAFSLQKETITYSRYSEYLHQCQDTSNFLDTKIFNLYVFENFILRTSAGLPLKKNELEYHRTSCFVVGVGLGYAPKDVPRDNIFNSFILDAGSKRSGLIQIFAQILRIQNIESKIEAGRNSSYIHDKKQSHY